MSNARNLADIVTGNFDVPLGALDNVPPSNDASALTTGTLPVGRLPSSGVSASALTTGTLETSRLPAGSVIQFNQYTVNTYLSGTLGGAANPAYNQGTRFTTFNFTPKSASSAIFLWSSNIGIYESSNINDVFYAAAYFDTSRICVNYTPVHANSFSSGHNAAYISVMGRAASWGTSTKTIDIRIGAGNSNGGSMQVNWDMDYYSQHGNNPAGSTIQFFVVEVV